MGRLSHFHSLIATNYKELYDDFMNSTNADFCKKHKIGVLLTIISGAGKSPCIIAIRYGERMLETHWKI